MLGEQRNRHYYYQLVKSVNKKLWGVNLLTSIKML